MANVAEATMTAPTDTPAGSTHADDPMVESAVDPVTGEATLAAPPEPVAATTYRFTGTPRNMVAGIAMLVASIMAFTMGMTAVFFAEATAWTLAIWGGLLIYAGMLDIFRVYEVTDDALLIKDDFRPWGRLKVWDWARLNRLDVIVKKPSPHPNDIEMQVYYNPEGQLANEREDRVFDPKLAQLIIDRAGLTPADRNTPADLTHLPMAEKQTFTWN